MSKDILLDIILELRDCGLSVLTEKGFADLCSIAAFALRDSNYTESRLKSLEASLLRAEQAETAAEIRFDTLMDLFIRVQRILAGRLEEGD